MHPREWLDLADELERMLSDLRSVDPMFGPECARALAERVEALIERIREEFAGKLN